MAHTRMFASVLAVLALGTLCMAGEVRSYVTGNFAVAIDGTNAGMTKSVDGGAIVADVISEPLGSDGIVHKHIGTPKYQDLKIQMGFSMSKQMSEWVAAACTPKAARRTVTVTELDYRLQPKGARQFDNAMISSVIIPAMDGSSKEPAYLGITITPENIRNGTPITKVEQSADKNIFLPSNFKLEIEGIDCTRVSKIDSFEIRREIAASNVGDARDATKTPGKLVVPNLHVEVAADAAQGFQQWHEQMVVQGKNLEKSGSLVLLAPAGGKELARIRFVNMGIFGIQSAKAEANAEQIKRVGADLYVESMTIEFAGGAISSTGADTQAGPAADAAPSAPVTPLRPIAPAGVRLLR